MNHRDQPASRHLVVRGATRSLALSPFVRYDGNDDWNGGRIGALAGRDCRPEWALGWCKRLWEGCETIGATLLPQRA